MQAGDELTPTSCDFAFLVGSWLASAVGQYNEININLF